MYERDEGHESVDISGGTRTGSANESGRPRESKSRADEGITGNEPDRLAEKIKHRNVTSRFGARNPTSRGVNR
jgi:hypothetical protein